MLLWRVYWEVDGREYSCTVRAWTAAEALRKAQGLLGCVSVAVELAGV